MHKHRKRRACFVSAAIASVALAAMLAGSASATSLASSERWFGTSVDSLIDVAYNTQYCASRNGNAYQIVNAEYRWYRTAKQRLTASENFGELGFQCTAGPAAVSYFDLSYTHAVTFTYDPNWSDDETYWPYGWPYVGAWGGGNILRPALGAWAKTTIQSKSGVMLGKFCNQVYLVGGVC